MDEKIYKITLSDGTELTNLKLNGNNYISEEPVTSEIFNGKLSSVIINDGSNDEVHENMDLVQIIEVNGKYWFILRGLSSKELTDIKLRADIEYIAMMTSVEL